MHGAETLKNLVFATDSTVPSTVPLTPVILALCVVQFFRTMPVMQVPN